MSKFSARKRDRSAPWEPETKRTAGAGLDPETKRGIVVVLIFLASFLILLSFFELAGPIGIQIDDGLGLAFGWARYLVPFLGFGLGLAWLRPERFRLGWSGYLGFILLLISTAGLFHLTISESAAEAAIDQGRGGGGLGFGLTRPLSTLVGEWATLAVLLAVFIISLLLAFNTTLHGLARQRTFMDRFFNWWRIHFYKLKIKLEDRRPAEPPLSEAPGFEKRELSAIEPNQKSGVPSIKDQAGPPSQLAIFPKPKRRHRPINLSLDLLEERHEKPTSGNIEANKQKIQKTLQTFGLEVEMGDINVGPTVTQYTLKPAEGVKLAQITTLQNDLALALAAHPIRIEAPIPGKSLVGVEVPNATPAVVSIKEVLTSDGFKNRRSNLAMALGKDVAGATWTADLDPMPHLLIAGATGTGKSVCINAIIMSLLYSNSPDDLKFIMVDPKRVELSVYNDIPHLLTPVIADIDKTINALRWVVGEMERRFELLSSTGKRNIQVYHREVDDGMPYIVVIIDELADLMAVAARDVEGAIIRLAQMARAVGIHLVVATQRPSVDVITGLIKANITARIAFNVASVVDSRTILDSSGAEKLLGKGDMLFISGELSKPKRLQGAFVSDREIERVVKHLTDAGKPEYVAEVIEKPTVASVYQDGESLGDDDMLDEAKETILRAGKASASLLQRRLRIGYARAARILDLLEEQGFIGPGEGAKPREILAAHSPPAEPFPDELEAADELDDDTDGPLDDEPAERG